MSEECDDAHLAFAFGALPPSLKLRRTSQWIDFIDALEALSPGKRWSSHGFRGRGVLNWRALFPLAACSARIPPVVTSYRFVWFRNMTGQECEKLHGIELMSALVLGGVGDEKSITRVSYAFN